MIRKEVASDFWAAARARTGHPMDLLEGAVETCMGGSSLRPRARDGDPCHLWPPQFSDGAEECLNCYFSAHVVSIDCLRQEDTDAWRRPVFGQPFSLSITSDGTAPAHVSDEFGDGGGVPKTNVFGTVFVTLTSTRWPEFPPARLLLQG